MTTLLILIPFVILIFIGVRSYFKPKSIDKTPPTDGYPLPNDEEDLPPRKPDEVN